MAGPRDRSRTRRRLLSDFGASAGTLAAGGAVAGAAALAGCTGTGDGAAPTPEATDTIELSGIVFHPRAAAVAVGTTVEWVNRDAVSHDVTSARLTDDGVAWEFARTLAPEETARHTFDSAGAYEYYCTVHGESTMCGVVLVGDASHGATLPCADGSGRDGGGYGY
ncbi:MAG: plastocyanin/azurin family copper-binding protein [Halobacteriaceae archaeon]